jgi:EARP and GARP complex-interacting protein 1
MVNLWRCSSVSSAPLLELDEEDKDVDSDDDLQLSGHGASSAHGKSNNKPSDAVDCIVKTYEDHEESVYAVAWSACDAWVFASLDFSGRLAINHVPSTEKYKILL